MEFDEMRWQLFLQICDKTGLDLKGDIMKAYKTNFDAAFNRAHNITLYYCNKAADVDERIKTVDDLDYDG